MTEGQALAEWRRQGKDWEFQHYLMGRRTRILGAVVGRPLLPVVAGLDRWLLLAVRRTRGLAYRAGARPRPGSILYSPSASLIYAMRDNPPADAFRAGLERKAGPDDRAE